MHEGSDDGFHEIQLSGKQLVFLFMATTVVSVVIFLCGVLVGRGVRDRQGIGNRRGQPRRCTGSNRYRRRDRRTHNRAAESAG